MAKMKPEDKKKMDAIIDDVDKVIKALDNMAFSMSNDFKNIGNEECAAALSEVSAKYKHVKRTLQKID